MHFTFATDSHLHDCDGFIAAN